MLTTGFTVIARPTVVEFRSYAQRRELMARLLSFAQDEGLSVLVMGRLYYRDDQLRRLRHQVEERTLDECRRSDAALAHALCRTGGIESLYRLEGDFALVCHDRTANRLVALRDPLGAYPVFWVHQAGVIALSTSIRPLVDLSSAELSIEYMADYLAFPTDVIAELPVRHTAYRDVQRLLPGWAWEARLSTRDIHCRPYWSWEVKPADFAGASVEEAGEIVRERLGAAVRERLSPQAQTASHFSGGLDSTGVALLASRMTAEVGRPLHALSLVYRRDRMLALEQEYIQAALRGTAGITPHIIPADDLLDFDDHEQIPPLDEPWALEARFKLVRTLVQAAEHAGADTVMTGDGADHFFAPPVHAVLGDLLAKGRVGQAWKLATRYSYVSSQSAGSVLLEAVKLRVPLRLRDGIRALLKGGRTPFEALTERTIPPWFTRDFIRRHRLRQRILDRQLPVFRAGVMTPADMVCVTGDANLWHVGVPHGVVICRPYWDPRLVALGLSLPTRLHARSGQMKPVLAAALRDVLPEESLRLRSKVLFGELNSGLAKNRESLEEIIRLAPVPDGIIDRPALMEALAKAALGIYAEAISVGRLRLTLSYLTWSSRREAWMKQSVRTAAVQMSTALAA